MKTDVASAESPFLSYLSLFTSFGTLICCALPSLLVLLGLGATVEAVLSAAPWLVTLSRHKGWVFAVSGTLIAGNLLYVYVLSPRLRARGETRQLASRILLWVSAGLYLAGFFTAYLMGPILVRFGS
jgi:hypothetical protein